MPPDQAKAPKQARTRSKATDSSGGKAGTAKKAATKKRRSATERAPSAPLDGIEVVCITGMHRSGTSLVSRVMNLLGIDLGPQDELMEPKQDNPSGFWENVSISGLNDDLLAALGGSWSEPPMPDAGWEDTEAMEPFRGRAAGILGRFEGSGTVGWKDPRTSLLLPFWRSVAPLRATALVVRHPWDVAASLASRDGMDAETASYLWLRYTVGAWRGDPDRLVVRYDAFFDDPHAEVDRLTAHLGVEPPSPEVRAEIDGFIDPSLRHYHEEPSGTGPETELAVLLFDLITEGRTAAADVLVDRLAAAWRDVRSVDDLTAMSDSLRIERDVAQEHLSEVITERDEALGERDKVQDELTADRDKALSERDSIQALLDEERQVIDTLNTNIDTLIAERDEALGERDKVQDELTADRDKALSERDSIQALLDEERQVIDTLNTNIDTLIAERDEALGERDKVQDELTADRDKALSERDSIQALLDEERQVIDTLNTNIDTLIGERQAALDERDNIQALLDEERQVIDTLNTNIDTLIGERQAALDSRDQVMAERNEARAAVDRLDADVAGLQNDVAGLRGGVAHLESRIAVQSDLLATGEAEAARIRQLWEEATARADESAARVEGLEVIIRRWRVDRLERLRRRLGFGS